jgi:small neutral amino acid transporter SnatA (MarC family)
MPELINYAVLSFSALFFILTPFYTVPTFLTITEGNTIDERLRMIKVASFTALYTLPKPPRCVMSGLSSC